MVFPEGGSQIMSIQEALRKAEEYGLDLIEVAPQSNPPVCKILDYGKFKYEMEKKMREKHKEQKASQLKEVRFRPATQEHDYEFKLKSIKEFLENKHKVRVFIKFRGREIIFKERGLALLERIKEDLKEIAKVEVQPRMEGRQLSMILTPISGKK